jgi:hypothetical protein
MSTLCTRCQKIIMVKHGFCLICIKKLDNYARLKPYVRCMKCKENRPCADSDLCLGYEKDFDFSLIKEKY